MCATTQAGTTLYVSPDGNDGNSGLSPEQPLRSPAAAQYRLREARREHGAEGPFSIVLADGVYYLDQALTFTAADGGSAEQPVFWCAAKNAKPVFSGGQPINGWHAAEQGNIWTTTIDRVARGDWYFHQLWVEGKRATRARYPNNGYLRTAGPLPAFENPRAHRGNRKASMGFRYRESDLQRWDNLNDINIYVYHAWTASLHWIDSVDADAGEVHFVNPSAWPIGWWERANQRYHVENFLEALDTPGEWYLDRNAGVLHYWPRQGENLASAEVIAPRLRHLVRVVGDGQAGEPVKGLHFQGIAFKHADWHIPDRGRPEVETQSRFVLADGQSASFTSAAVYVAEAQHISFERCEIAHVGEYGLWLAHGARNCTLREIHIHDLGAGAVRIGDSSSPQADWQVVENNVVDNCFLHDGGHVFPAGCGILLQRAICNKITHNEICDFYYTGISLGWSWGFAATSAHHNIVRYNNVHHLGWGVLSDMGGVYTLGVSPGTEITHNIFHNICSCDYGGWGLYADEGSTGIVMSHNLVYNTQSGGFHQHYGLQNLVCNNIFAFSTGYQLQRTYNEDRKSFLFERNIVVFDNGNLIGGNWSNDQFEIRGNLYHDFSGALPDFNGLSFEQWQQRGHDIGSLVADPLFVRNDFSDRKTRPLTPADFQLRENSPALKLRFEQLELDRAGLYGCPRWVNLPETIERPQTTFREYERERKMVDAFRSCPPCELQVDNRERHPFQWLGLRVLHWVRRRFTSKGLKSGCGNGGQL